VVTETDRCGSRQKLAENGEKKGQFEQKFGRQKIDQVIEIMYHKTKVRL
jgi:hypothetical protein